ncbi:MAG: sulfotransferase [Candidatus Omnitrophica bacterium]|nr:sulfotransferase [Candidatus Omnitrophota bacterium]
MPEIHEQYQKFNELKAIFIGGLNRSGTSLVLRLLDGHPKLLVYPTENCMIRDYFSVDSKHPIRKGMDEGMASRDAQKVFDHIRIQPRAWQLTRLRIKASAELLWQRHPHPERISDVFTSFNIQDFEKCFIVTLNLISSEWDIGHLVRAWNFSYFWTLGIQDMTKFSGWVSKCPNSENHYGAYLSLFPKGRTIHILRDPRAIFISAKEKKKFSGQGQRELLSLQPFKELVLSIQTYKNRWAKVAEASQLYPSDFKILKYEDLIQNPQREMEKISHFLGIEYDAILLTPTFMGDPWYANSSFELQKDKTGIIFQDSLKRWQKEISIWERLLLNCHFSKILKEWNYPRY